MAEFASGPTRDSAAAIAPEMVERFAAIDTTCLGDILMKMNLHTVVEGFSPIAPGMRLCGPASTVRIMAAQDWRKVPPEFSPNAIGIVLNGGCRPGDVLVMECGGRTDRSTWGSMAALVAKENGLAGAVIDGAARDIDMLLELDWPVFSRSVTVRGPAGPDGSLMVRTACVDSEPVQIGGGTSAVTVVPGDLVVADDHVVCVVPAGRIVEVLDLVTPYHEADMAIWPQLKTEVRKNPKDAERIRGVISGMVSAGGSGE